jgi:hypothetical protein
MNAPHDHDDRAGAACQGEVGDGIGRPPGESLLVEFAGLRGVGKSTLIPLVRDALRRRGIAVGRPRLRPDARIALTLRALGLRVVVRWRVRPWPPLSRAARSYDRRLTRYLHRMLRAAGHPGVHLIDGGIGQLLMTLHADGARPDPLAQWDALTGLLPLPDMMAVLTAEDDQIERRRAARGTTADRQLPRPAEHERAALRALEAYLTEGRRHDRVELVRLAANDAPASLAQLLADVIERRYADRRARELGFEAAPPGQGTPLHG